MRRFGGYCIYTGRTMYSKNDKQEQDSQLSSRTPASYFSYVEMSRLGSSFAAVGECCDGRRISMFLPPSPHAYPLPPSQRVFSRHGGAMPKIDVTAGLLAVVRVSRTSAPPACTYIRSTESEIGFLRPTN